MSRTTFSGPVASTNGFVPTGPSNLAVNATATITAQNLQVGYITSTSAGATTITLPLLLQQVVLQESLRCSKRSTIFFIVDNTGGAAT
jgi:hypothetical protein